MTMDALNVTTKVCLDCLLLIFAGLPILIFKFGIQPFKRGFFCDDESIAHPYKEQTISTAVLITVSIGLPVVAMSIAELILYRKTLSSMDLENQVKQRQSFSLLRRSVHPYLASVYVSVGAFLLGAAICQGTTDLMKYSLGRLRPHFLDACQPNWSAIECTDSEGFMRYVEDFECLGDPKHVREARLSHPSGHSSLSFFCMLYLSIYLQHKMQWLGSKLLRHFLQFAMIYLAVYTCMSRVSDYYHHWSDVLGGAVLGSVVAIITAVYISDLCKKRQMQMVVQKLREIEKSVGRYDGNDSMSIPSPAVAANNDLSIIEGQRSLQI